MRTTSLKALQKLTDSGKREYNSLLIAKVLKRYKKGLTRREIEEKTGLRPNQVSGRVFEMIKQKRLSESGVRKCRITGNEVNVVCYGR